MDNICALHWAMIKDGAQNVLIAQLPEACRPKANRLIFNMNLQDRGHSHKQVISLVELCRSILNCETKIGDYFPGLYGLCATSKKHRELVERCSPRLLSGLAMCRILQNYEQSDHVSWIWQPDKLLDIA